MPNPQQPGLRRRGRGSTVDDSAKARARDELPSAEDRLPDDATPEGNRPGHHPDEGQDQPDPDRFAERLGLADDENDQASPPDA